MSHVMHVYFHLLFLNKEKQGRQLFHFIPINQLDLKITTIFWTMKLSASTRMRWKIRIYDTSYKVFIEWSLRRTQHCRMCHVVEIFPLVSDAKINHGVDAILVLFVSWIVEIVRNNRSNLYNSIRLTSPLIENWIESKIVYSLKLFTK